MRKKFVNEISRHRNFVLVHLLFLSLLLSGIGGEVMAQEKKEKNKSIVISGKVTDEEKAPLPGVTVLVKEGTKGVGCRNSRPLWMEDIK